MTERSENFIILEKVDSTNNYAMAMVQNEMINNGDAVFAWQQTAGKGRRGKAWSSAKGQNVILTVVCEMQWLSLSNQFQLSVAVSLACYDFVKKYVDGNIKIKWPNDIYINDRKAGGILIENVVKGQLWQWAVIGVGLNVNQEEFESISLAATSLKQTTGNSYDVVALSRELHEHILKRIKQSREGNFDKMLEEYNERLFAANKKVRLKKGPVIFETTIKRVAPSGELITKDAFERSFAFDEIEWLL